MKTGGIGDGVQNKCSVHKQLVRVKDQAVKAVLQFKF